MPNLSPHEKAAEQETRDENGHFAKKVSEQTSQPSTKSFFNKFFSNGPKENTDTLIDVHVNNPLHKITSILEDIKKQKAFSFYLKGSLGLTGILVLVAGASLFGGFKVFCNKGLQSHLGKIKILALEEKQVKDFSSNSTFSYFWEKVKSTSNSKLNFRTILAEPNGSLVHIERSASLKDFTFTPFVNQEVIITGEYDSCSNTLLLNSENAIEPSFPIY